MAATKTMITMPIKFSLAIDCPGTTVPVVQSEYIQMEMSIRTRARSDCLSFQARINMILRLFVRLTSLHHLQS